MERTLIKQLKEKSNKQALIKARAINIRKLGKITFILAQDRTGTIQVVCEKPSNAKIGDIIEIIGIVKKDERAKGNFEINAQKEKIISSNVEDLPFDIAKNELNLDLNNLLNYRTLSLRHKKTQAISKLYDLLLKEYL